MPFAQTLKALLVGTDCTAQELAEASEVPASSISRYLSGDRTPSRDGNVLPKLAHGLCVLAAGNAGATAASNEELADGFPTFYLQREEEILAVMRRSVEGDQRRHAPLGANLRSLMETLGISAAAIARATSFDPSYVSRILAGTRLPADTESFIGAVARYVAKNYVTDEQVLLIAELVGCTEQEARDVSVCTDALVTYLESEATSQGRDSVDSFLRSLDSYDLGSFLSVLSFAEERKEDAGDAKLSEGNHVYEGLKEMERGELDFFARVAKTPSDEQIILYTDMPLECLATDTEFVKLWMWRLAKVIKGGARLTCIHDLQRPLKELIIGLEAWIPLYMTGCIESRYLPIRTDHAFLHHVRSAVDVGLLGEAIAGHFDEGRFMLLQEEADVAYCRKRAQALYGMSRSLLRVFREDSVEEMRILKATLKRCQARTKASPHTVGEGTFERLAISVLPGQYALVTRVDDPVIHFLVEHRRLVDALDRFEPMVHA